jgi:hypothetical protein
MTSIPSGNIQAATLMHRESTARRISSEAGNVGFHQQTTPVSAGTASRCSAAGMQRLQLAPPVL